jgi:hypothetical protein
LPVVLVTQGTLANNDLTELIEPTLRALEHEDVFVIAATGREASGRMKAIEILHAGGPDVLVMNRKDHAHTVETVFRPHVLREIRHTGIEQEKELRGLHAHPVSGAGVGTYSRYQNRGLIL